MMKAYNDLRRSFGHAIGGVSRVVKERNMRIHIVVAVVVIACGFLLKLSALEWIAIALASGGVFASETFNTAIEMLSDRVCDSYDANIKLVKDVAAAAVVIQAVAAVITGLIIFIPKIALFIK